VQLNRNDKKAEALTGERLSFNTQAGDNLTLSPHPLKRERK
jgi:hypothetical protein